MTGSLVPPSASIAGRYTVERELGHGATATVYLARDQVHGRPVALKVLRPELTASVGADRFLREIRLTAQLHHPHIVPVLDSGEHDGMLFCVLPYMDGGTLRDRLERERQLPIAEAVAIARTVGEALAYAHERGIIHRDVKPENILFSVGQPCLADFGIARALESVSGEVTSTGVVRGTPAYMSPEQAAGDRTYDGRSDVYSLACVLYETITGMPAFIGPTTQSLLAQRMLHQPREMGLYRERVSAELESVVEKALRPVVADRYAGVREFVEALASVPLEEGRGGGAQATTSRASRTQRGWRATALAAAGVAIIGIAGAYWRSTARDSIAGVAAADTTRVVVLPFERSPGITVNGPEDELLYESFLGWQPTKPVDRFQVQDALARLPEARTSDAAARRLVAQLGAARYVRGRLTAITDSVRVTAALFDVRSSEPLYQTLAAYPRNQNGVDSVFAGLARVLLLRGRDDGARARASSRSLPAIGAFADGMSAALAWDLERADSLFQAAVAFDPTYARASLWLAQVRAWREQPTTSWLSLAERATGSPSQLLPHEQAAAAALVALARGEYERACREYTALDAANPRDFAALYGLGQCRSLDSVLVRDASMPFGWRYRSSYEQAVQAYARAFEAIPSALNRFQAGSFQPLRELLLTRTTKIQPAYAPGDTERYFGRPDWRGDTLVLVPIPLSLIRASDPRASPPGIARAVAHQRALFHRIAAGWSATMPRSAGAKEAVAVALETLGDPAAADTLRLARSLSNDPQQRLRLAAAEAVVTLKFAVPDRAGDVARARRLADSLLADAASATGPRARALRPLAVLTGRCALASALVRRTPVADPIAAGQTSVAVADAELFTEMAALGCNEVGAPSPGDIAASLPPGPDHAGNVSALLTRAMRIRFDAGVVSGMANADDDYVLHLERAVRAGNRGEVRQRLTALARLRDVSGWDNAYPEAILEEARLWSEAGDPGEAAQWLDRYLPRVRLFVPGVLSSDPITLATLLHLMIMRADLAAAAGDTSTARQWARPVVALWSAADADLQPTVRRLSKYIER